MRKIALRLLISLSLLASPFSAQAQGALSIDDVVAGFGTTVHLSGVPADAEFVVHLTAPDGEQTVIPVSSDETGEAVADIPAQLVSSAGTYRIVASIGNTSVTPLASFEVLSDRVDTRASQITVSDALLPADGRSVSTVTVTLKDARGNPLPGRPVQLVGSRTQDRITPLTGNRETDRNGIVQFAVQTQTPGSIALRAMDMLSGLTLDRVAQIAAHDDGQSVGGFRDSTNAFRAQLTGSDTSADETAEGTAPVAIAEAASPEEPFHTAADADIIDHFLIKTSVDTVRVGDVIPLVSVTAVDRNNLVVEGYNDTVTINTPSDDKATLPLNKQLKFTGNRRGKYDINWLISFTKSGLQKIVVTDSSGTITGEATVTVTGEGQTSANRRIRLDTPDDDDTVSTQEVLFKGKGEPLTNLKLWITDAERSSTVITDGEPDARGETDADGTFSFTAKLKKSGDALIEIQSDNGDSSGMVRIHTDFDGPLVEYSFDPQEPSEGGDVTLTATSEPALASMKLLIHDQEIDLTEGEPGTYQVLFQAPSRGDMNFTMSARDAAGNVTDIDGRLAISGPNLPQVQNVAADPLARGIQLTWDAIPDDTLTGYRIEVGKSPGRPETTLDTPEPTDSAAVMGLKAGSEYVVTLRAKRGDDIGPPSTPLVARTLGMEITVTPQDGSLLLQWTFPDATPLSSFLLEYGTPEGEYSEQRMLEGTMRAFTLNDLLAQQYVIRMTPVAITGEVLSDLTAMAEGTPTQAIAFHASADELVHHVRLTDVAPDDTLHEGAPEVTSSGLPGIPVRMVLVITGIAAGLYWYRRKRALRQTQEFLQGMHQRYHS